MFITGEDEVLATELELAAESANNLDLTGLLSAETLGVWRMSMRLTTLERNLTGNGGVC